MNNPGPSALPPTTIHSTQSISQSAAHDFLAAYLTRAATDPALQPNANISEHGPVSRTTAAAPNLILHNLKRVQAGLTGEVLGQDLTFAKQNPGEEYLDAGLSGGKGEEAEAGDDLEMTEPAFEMEAEAYQEQEGEQATIDKEERKRLKKERRNAEKKAKAQKESE
ncbi:hypothetical protein N7507_007334 [Penicillium longicatenatum]|nr:hypothetical protein N7507_007334 [Penicillium longicatenatum]